MAKKATAKGETKARTTKSGTKSRAKSGTSVARSCFCALCAPMAATVVPRHALDQRVRTLGT